MIPNLEDIAKSKRAFRQRLARVPIAEKLRMLDARRERILSIRATPSPPLIHEDSPRYRPGGQASSSAG